MPPSSWAEIVNTSDGSASAEQPARLPVWNYTTKKTEVTFDGFTATFPPPTSRIYGQINKAVRFKSGDLLFNVHPTNVCFHFSQATKRFTYVFELDWGPGTFLWSVLPDQFGNVFCTLSGMRTAAPIVDSDFGNWGGIIAVNPRKHAMRTIAERGTVVDPYGLQLLPDGRLLVTDFTGFGASGTIYAVDPLNGHLEVLAQGNYLVDPTTSFIDDNQVLWIANGDQNGQDGEILSLDLKTKNLSTVFPRQGPMSGALLGVSKSHDPRFIIATKNEWDQRVKSAVMLIEKATGAATNLLQASEDNPQFFSTICCVVGTTLWTAECCNRELIEYDLARRVVLNKFDLTPIMGGYRGMRNSFDAISGFYAVP
jgi:hypothetical protein